LRSRWWAGRVQTAWHWQQGEAPGAELWLLIEWPKEQAEPSKYYLCDLPPQMSCVLSGKWLAVESFSRGSVILELR
jgi:hypothetical protein